MQYIRALLSIVLPFHLSGCLVDSQADSTVGFEVIAADVAPANGIIENRKIEFIADQFALNEVSARYTSGPAGGVDFTHNQVVLLNVGQSSDRVTGILIERVSDEGGTLALYATERVAGEGCFTPATITSPYVIVRIFNTARIRAVFVNRETIACGV